MDMISSSEELALMILLLCLAEYEEVDRGVEDGGQMADAGEVLHPGWPGQVSIRLVGIVGVAKLHSSHVTAHLHVDQFPHIGDPADTVTEQKHCTDLVNILTFNFVMLQPATMMKDTLASRISFWRKDVLKVSLVSTSALDSWNYVF